MAEKDSIYPALPRRISVPEKESAGLLRSSFKKKFSSDLETVVVSFPGLSRTRSNMFGVLGVGHTVTTDTSAYTPFKRAVLRAILLPSARVITNLCYPDHVQRLSTSVIFDRFIAFASNPFFQSFVQPTTSTRHRHGQLQDFLSNTNRNPDASLIQIQRYSLNIDGSSNPDC